MKQFLTLVISYLKNSWGGGTGVKQVKEQEEIKFVTKPDMESIMSMQKNTWRMSEEDF